MRNSIQAVLTLALGVMLCGSGMAADKELIELQTQVQTLQDQLSRLQRSLDENIGVTADRMKRNAENIGKMQQAMQEIQSRLAKQNETAGTTMESISSQVNALQAATGELKGRLEKVMQKAVMPPVQLQSGPAVPQATASLATPPHSDVQKSQSTQPATVPQSAPPSPNNNKQPGTEADLYEIAMQHYASKDFESAANEFTKYLKMDRQSSKAVSAQFYLAEIEYQQQDFEGALDDYTDVGPRLTDPSRAATVQYKKALCLLEVERVDEAMRELQSVVERYPSTPEATRAAKKLRALQAKRSAAQSR